jgi:hypothetical protein
VGDGVAGQGGPGLPTERLHAADLLLRGVSPG